jgi:hypothetical protein
MFKIALIDKVTDYTEPYPRPYVLGLVANVCANTPFMRNASMTTIQGHGYRDSGWESHQKPMHYVSFEVDSLTAKIWEILQQGQDYWGLCELKVLPDGTETTIIHASEFK